MNSPLSVNDPTESVCAPTVLDMPAPRRLSILNGVLIGAHAVGALGYLGIGANFIGWETCNIPGADGGADMVAGLFFLPVLFVVLLVSLGCLFWAAYIYAKHRCWPFNRYVLAVPAFWAFAVFILRCPTYERVRPEGDGDARLLCELMALLGDTFHVELSS